MSMSRTLVRNMRPGQVNPYLAAEALRERRAFVAPAGPAKTPRTRRRRAIVRGLERQIGRAQRLELKALRAELRAHG
jgi:hypothetical protein